MQYLFSLYHTCTCTLYALYGVHATLIQLLHMYMIIFSVTHVQIQSTTFWGVTVGSGNVYTCTQVHSVYIIAYCILFFICVKDNETYTWSMFDLNSPSSHYQLKNPDTIKHQGLLQSYLNGSRLAMHQLHLSLNAMCHIFLRSHCFTNLVSFPKSCDIAGTLMCALHGVDLPGPLRNVVTNGSILSFRR